MKPRTSRLQLRDYRLILAIQETGQLALAAEHLGMTQPAASRALANIERIIGAPVFRRHPKGMIPTIVGQTLAASAGELLSGLDQALEEVDSVLNGRAGTVRVGSVTGGAVGFVVPAIQQLKKTAPSADIHVHIAPSDDLIEGLLQGDHDFALSRIPPGVDARQFAVRRGRVEIIRFVTRSSHPLAGRPDVTLADIASHEWVIQAPHTPLRHAVEEAFITAGVPLPKEIVNTTSLLLMTAYLESSEAIAPIPLEVADLVCRKDAQGGLTTLNYPEPIVINPYHLISRRDRHLSPLATRLRDLVQRGLSGEGPKSP